MSDRSKDSRTRTQLLEEVEQLRDRLEEAEETLEAIRNAEVDALVVAGPQGEQVFSITGRRAYLPRDRRDGERGGPDGGPGWDDPLLQSAFLRPDEDPDSGGDGPQSNDLRRPAPASRR